jgi:hypothetical protein
MLARVGAEKIEVFRGRRQRERRQILGVSLTTYAGAVVGIRALEDGLALYVEADGKPQGMLVLSRDDSERLLAALGAMLDGE